MAGVLPPVVATLVMDSKQFQEGAAKADAAMGRLGATSETTGQRIGRVANKASNYILGIGVAVGAMALKTASTFQTLTTQIVTGAGESAKNLDLIRTGLLNMAGQVGQTPADLAKGLYMIESAGYHGAAGLAVLKASAEGARVGAADMATVAGAVTTVMHDYGLGVKSAASVTSALIQTVASGKTHLEDLGNSLGKLIPTAAAVGLKFSQVGAAMAVQTNAGMSARLAAMHTNALLLSLLAPNSKQLKVFQAIGLSAQQVKDMLVNSHEGLAFALDEINKRISQQIPAGTAEYVAAMKAAYGTTASLSTVLAIAGKHTKEFNADAAAIQVRMNSTSQSVQGWALAQKDLSTQLAKLKGAGESVLIGIGDWLLPKATAVAKWGEGVIAWFRDHPLMSKIASDSALGLFAAALAYKIGKALYTAFTFVKGIFTGTAIDANTVATQENTAALLRSAGLSTGEGVAVGAGAGAAGTLELGALARGTGIAAGTGLAAFFATTEALRHNLFGLGSAVNAVTGMILGPTQNGTTGYAGNLQRLLASRGITSNATIALDPATIRYLEGRTGGRTKKVTVTHRTKYGR